MSAEAKLVELNLQLPPIPKPGGVYKPVVIVGNMAYVSGHVSLKPDGSIITGRVGADVDQDFGKKAAEAAGLAILATLRHNLGSLDRIKRVVKTLGMVNSTAEFTNHPEVINGCSELWAERWSWPPSRKRLRNRSRIISARGKAAHDGPCPRWTASAKPRTKLPTETITTSSIAVTAGLVRKGADAMNRPHNCTLRLIASPLHQRSDCAGFSAWPSGLFLIFLSAIFLSS
jgi:enamine deaminase RidA (YjgF/YER057c/UK114 family)